MTTSDAHQANLTGNGVGVLLLHGLGGTPEELRFVAQQFSDAGVQVSCPLLRGHGGSDLLLNTTSWQDWVQSAEQALDELRKTCRAVIVGGQSSGAVVALQLAAAHPEKVQGLALYAPMMRLDGWAMPRWLRLIRFIRAKWVANLVTFREREPFGVRDEPIRRVMLESMTESGRDMRDIFGRRGGTLVELHRLVETVEASLGAIRQPALIVHARNDDQTALASTHRLQRRLGGLVDVLVLEDSYHRVTIDRQRDLVAERSLAFAADVAERAGLRPAHLDTVDEGALKA